MKVTFRGHTFDARTIAMIRWAEKRAGFTFTIAQGSYNTGGVAAAGALLAAPVVLVAMAAYFFTTDRN